MTRTEDNGNTRKSALDYLARGWSVVPVLAGEKRPAIPWQAWQEARPERAEVEKWFERRPDLGVAVVTGAVSGLLVLDVDPRRGGADSLRRLEAEHGPLPPTPEVRTGGGGRHLYFAHPGRRVRNRVALMPGIDVRGDGGLVVAPPTLHPSGRRYAWMPGRSPAEIAPAPPPAWLRRRLGDDRVRRGHPLAHWRTLVREGVEEGARNTTLASRAGHLLWHGVDPEVVLELLLAWNRARCRPPLDDREVASVVASITRLHQREEEHAG